MAENEKEVDLNIRRGGAEGCCGTQWEMVEIGGATSSCASQAGLPIVIRLLRQQRETAKLVKLGSQLLISACTG